MTDDGIKFPSLKEARRYQELVLLQKAGLIRSLKLQHAMDLAVHVGGERAVIGFYVADFLYQEMVVDDTAIMLAQRVRWVTVVEDAKGVRTPLYRWKKKHVRAQYGIEIRET